MFAHTSVQEYLEVLYKLTEAGGGPASTSQVSERLGVSAASVSEMFRRLADQGLVEHVPYRGATLTGKGRLEGAHIIRYHRLWEAFLVDVLGMDWDEVHDEACRLEHATSHRVAQQLAAFLDEPLTCPHGHPLPVPGRGGSYQGRDEPETPTLLLSDAPDGFVGEVAAIEEDSDLLRHCARIGLIPGARFRVTEGAAVDQVLNLFVALPPAGAGQPEGDCSGDRWAPVSIGPGIGRRVQVIAKGTRPEAARDRGEAYAS